MDHAQDHHSSHRSMRVGVYTFDGQSNPGQFSDWVKEMNWDFDWYDISPHRQVKFINVKLVGSTQLYWELVEQEIYRRYEQPITNWVDMRSKLKERYVPRYYEIRLLKQYNAIHQGSSSVADYITQFEDIQLRCGVRERPDIAITRFKEGLRHEIQREVRPYFIVTLEQV